MLRRYLLPILLVLLPTLLFSQVSSGKDQLREGLLLFKQEKYQDAIRVFRVLISDAQDDQSQEVVADAYYWISRAYLAVDNYEEAARNLEYFLSNYASHPYYADGLYQKGRLLYLQGDAESGIQVLESYVREYPNSEFVGSAYFWLGECLFSLGQLEEAAQVYNKVIVDHPKSVKLEASRYRLSMIEYQKRENELLKLLKWSHEEALKSVEEFKRREKAYEQAIDVYQRKLSSGAVTAEEKAALEQLRSENESLKNKIRGLEAQIAALSEGIAEESVEPGRLETIEYLEKALQVKADALAVKESLLQRLAEEPEEE
ncbi:MAG: tetratricopeptide repeat protein [Spirochaetaceae bacterium]|nr:MAG: tetratricopeptide repeat protein [Spirochaetaceae bacterium]